MKKINKTNSLSRLKRLLSMMVLLSLMLTVCVSANATSNEDFEDISTINDSVQTNLSLKCKSAVLMEATTGAILYEQNADEALPPASVTKIMTLLLVMEAIENGKIKYTDTVRASANACSMGGSQIYLEENEEMSVEDLIKSVVIASANDAAVALAEYISGTEEAFVEEMNKKAKALGMNNTNFENTNGLDDTVTNHLTSAKDIAVMSRELIKYPKITEYSSIWMDSIRNGEFGLTNTNRLVRFYKGATGLKTGSTSKAGFCISATAQREGMSLICVIMGAESRDIRNAAATSLLDYGFANYGVYTHSGESIQDVPIQKGVKATVDLKYESFSTVLPKKEIGEIKAEIVLTEPICAPVSENNIVGNVIYKIGEKEIGKSDIIAVERIEKLTFFSMFIGLLKKCAQIV